MPLFRKLSLKAQLLIILLLALLVPTAAMLYDIFYATKTDDVLIHQTEEELIQIVDMVSKQMRQKISAEPEHQNKELPEIFKSVVDPLINHYPGVRICLYEKDTGGITIRGYLHEFRSRLPEEEKERERRIYNETKAGIASVLAGGTPITRLGITYDDRFLEHLRPFEMNNRTAAVIWAEKMIHPIFAHNARVRLILRYVIFFVFGLGTAAALFTIAGVVNRIQTIKDGLVKMEKDLDNKLPEMPGEFGHITTAVNNMARVITEKQQLIDQYRKSENLLAMGRTITEIAHELRAPVSVIQATTQAMELNIQDIPQLKEYVDRIDRQVVRHNKLINEILEFGRPAPVIMETIDLNDLIKSVIEINKPLLLKTDIKLEFKTIEHTPLIIKGNTEKLKQVFINLIFNAMEAMRQKGTITIQTNITDKGQAVVSVRDTGEGIRPEDLPNIFEPFYSKKAVGSGLGLAISKRIIQIHDGHIDVESEAGIGSIFTVYLPIIQQF